MRVTKTTDGDSRGEIEITAAVNVPQITSRPPIKHQLESAVRGDNILVEKLGYPLLLVMHNCRRR
jgi:hypothetical protein